jgi:hypothetical protein
MGVAAVLMHGMGPPRGKSDVVLKKTKCYLGSMHISSGSFFGEKLNGSGLKLR